MFAERLVLFFQIGYWPFFVRFCFAAKNYKCHLLDRLALRPGNGSMDVASYLRHEAVHLPIQGALIFSATLPTQPDIDEPCGREAKSSHSSVNRAAVGRSLGSECGLDSDTDHSPPSIGLRGLSPSSSKWRPLARNAASWPTRFTWKGGSTLGKLLNAMPRLAAKRPDHSWRSCCPAAVDHN